MADPRRILYVLNGTLGGANLSAHQLIEHLPADRFAASLIYPAGLGDLPADVVDRCDHTAAVPLTSWQWYRDVPVRDLPRTWIGSFARLRVHWPAARQIVRLCRAWNIDLVHTNTSTTLASALAARMAGLPHVWHIREMIGPHTPFQFPPNDPLSARVFAGLSARLITNSDQTALFFRRYLPKAPVTVIDNGFLEPPADLIGRGRALRHQLGIPAEACVIAQVANLNAEWKRHDLFLEAAIRVAHQRPQVWIVLFGGFSETPYVARLRQMIRESGLESRIMLAGHINDPWSVMSLLDILGHGTHQESFGRVFVEAMLAGKPVVTPHGGGALSIVVDGETGYLTEPGSIEDLSARFLALVDHPPLIQQMGAAGAQRARERFSMAAHVSAITRLYDTIPGVPR